MRNLVFFGIPESEKSYFDLEEIIVKMINEKVEVECFKNEIQHIRRLGKKTDKPRPVIVGFTTYGMKIRILKNKSKLEGTGNYIKEDFSPKILNERKELQEQLKKERENGKNAIIKYNKIIILPNYNKENKIKTKPIEKTIQNKKRSLEKSPVSGKTNMDQDKNRAPKKNKPSTENRNITQYLKTQERKALQWPDGSQNTDTEKNES